MTLRAARWFTLLAVPCLLLFVFLSYQRRVDDAHAAAYRSEIEKLSALHSRRQSEVLRAHSGLVTHYDGMAQVESALRRLHRRLEAPPAHLSAEAKSDILAKVERSDKTRVEGERLVERFKKNQAVLRNSLSFLTTLAAKVATFQPRTSEGEVLATSLDTLLRDLLVLQLTQDERSTLQARRTLGEFRKKRPLANEWPEVNLDLVVMHGDVVLKRSSVVSRVVRDLGALPAQHDAGEVLASYSHHQRAAIAQRNSDRMILFALVLLTGAGIAAYIILRLRRSALELRSSSVQLERAVESLRIERNKQRELTDLKSRFVSMTSHEFRTPLSVIVSSSEMLSAYADTLSSEKKETHQLRIRTAAMNMTHMLDDILLIGKVEAGKLEFDPTPIKLDEFCAEVSRAAEQTSGAHERVVNTRPIAGETVVADEHLLRHVLENLLSNALKYSDSGEKVVFDAAVEDDAVVFRVSDSGIGIPTDDQKHLFSSFHRGSNVGKIAGTGLGLSIVKRAVDLHQGTLSFDSRVGEGTRFDVRIPANRSAA